MTICATPSISSPSSLLVDALADPQRRFDVRREIRLVAEMAAAAHHREIHAHLPAQRDDRENIDVVVAADFDRLLMQHGRKRAHLVAHRRGLLEFQLGGEAMHLLLEFLHHFALPAEQETRCIRHIARVILVADQADARSGAAPDLMQQTRPRAVREHRVLAGAQLEDALQDLDALAHGPRARERPEVLVLLVDGAAVISHARKLMAGQLEIGIGLVVAKEDVVARGQRLDEIVLKQKRFGFGTRDGRLDLADPRDHHRDARRMQRLREIARYALLQVARLADVQYGAVGVVVAVDAGQMGQLRENLLGVENVGVCHAAEQC